MRIWKPLYYLILGLCFGAAIFLSFTSSIQVNESYSVWLATKSVFRIFQSNAQSFTLPLYPVLLHFWVQVLGADIVTVRFLSILFLVFTVYFLYRVSFEASGNEEISVVTVVLFALSPLILWYSTEAQTYALFTMIVAASHLYFLRLKRSGGHEGKLGYFLVTLAGFFTNYLFVILAFSQIVYVITGSIFFRSVERWKWNRFVAVYFILTLVNGALFAYWLYYLVSLGLTLPQKLHIAPESLPLAGQLFTSFFFGFTTINLQKILIAIWPISVVFLFLIFTRDAAMKLRSALYFIIVTFLPILLTFSVSFLQPFFSFRSLIFTVPTLFILTGWLLFNFSRKVFSLALLIVVVTIGAMLIAQLTSPVVPIRENYKAVDAYVNAHVTPYDIVAVASPFAVYPVEYYYAGAARITTIPQWSQYSSTPIPRFSLDRFVTQVHSYKGTYGRLFVILSYDQGYNSSVSYYLDHNYERLAFHVYPPNIELRVYRLSYNFPVPPLP